MSVRMPPAWDSLLSIPFLGPVKVSLLIERLSELGQRRRVTVRFVVLDPPQDGQTAEFARAMDPDAPRVLQSYLPNAFEDRS